MSSRPRAPWWIYVIGAVLLFTLSFEVWVEFMGPETSGFDWKGATPTISTLRPGSPIEAAGARVGDRIIAVDGQKTDNMLDWIATGMTFEMGKPIALVVQRGPQTLDLSMTLHTYRFRSLKVADYVSIIFLRAAQLMCCCLALLLLASRPTEITAWLAAWLLASLGVFNVSPFRGGAALLHHLPWPLAVAFALPILLANVAPIAWGCFFFSFPRRRLTKPWHWALAVFCGSPVLLHGFWQAQWILFPGRPARFLTLPTFLTVGAFVAGYELAGLGMLVWNYVRLQDVNEKRKLRIMMVGMLIGWPAAMAAAVGSSAAVVVVGSVLFLAFPFSFAYAILKQRLFDVRVIIRQGLQYAVARGVLLYIVPLCIGILVLDLGLHKDQTVGALMAQRGWPYAALALVAGVAHVKRRGWMQALDRRFFRERYNAQKVLRELVEEIRGAGSLEEEAPRAVARIESALHPEFAALLVRTPGEARYRCLAVAPAGAAVSGVDAGSKLVGLMRVLGKPLHASASDSSWLRSQLPHEETDFLRDARIELLVPVALGPNAIEALLVFGPKRSEEPYGAEDQELLLAIAGALALLLERPTVAPARSAYGECAECGTCYDSGTARCGSDGATLTPMPFPRMLASRYRLEKRLGRGGMGTVYRASDVALEREVAVKMLREDLIANAEAAERFRREARMSASVTHPNLVVIHDFGIESGRGAFLVMELLMGKNLRQQLLQTGRLPVPRALEILRGVCAAVEAAHKRGLIHRDLKPENIFLTTSNMAEVPKVLDFGVAKLVAQSPNSAMPTADTGDGVLLGTSQYMCPEQLRGELVEPSWDVWALAVIAYEVLTGTHPFPAPTIAAVHSAVLEGRFRPVRDFSDLPSGLDGFFRSALATERARRPGSATELLLLLQQSVAAGRAAGA